MSVPPLNASFIQLIPKGTGFPDSSSSAVSDNEMRHIQPLREEFLDLYGYCTDRKLRNEERLHNKPAFIEGLESCNVSLPVIEALLCDRDTLFQEGYAVYQQNHDFFTIQRTQGGKNPVDQHHYCTEHSLHHALHSEQAIFRAVLDQMAAGAKNPLKQICAYYDALMKLYRESPDGEEPAALLAYLRFQLPGVPLTEQNILRFLLNCLAEYHRISTELSLIAKESGHFRPRYSREQREEAWAYSERRQSLLTLRDSLAEQFSKLSFPFAISESFGGYSESASVPTASSDIHDALAGYFSHTRTEIDAIDPHQLALILSSLQKRSPELLPIRLLILCVACGGALFTRSRESDIDAVMQFPKHVYRAKPKLAAQRSSRLALLLRLCQIFAVSPADVQTNLLYFIKYHGCVIQSDEEARIWNDFMQQYPSLDEAVTLPLKYYEYLRFCLPLHPERLYCYENCSALQLGGFAAFLKEFPSVAEDLCSPVQQKKIPKNLRTAYASQYSAVKPDREEIKKICSKIAQTRDWSILEQTNSWIVQYNLDSANKRHFPPVPIDLEELKRLLAELAMQSYLCSEAKQLLLSQLTRSERSWRERLSQSRK